MMVSDPDLLAFVAQVRRDIATEMLPRAARAKNRWPVDITETTLAEVPCQSVVAQGTEPTKDLLYVFGGGYISGSPDYDLPATAALACLTNARVIAPRYPLTPEHPSPAALTHVMRVWQHVAETGRPCLGIAGESAGGGLALALALSCAQNTLPKPAKLALLSPWVDLTPSGLDACIGQDDPMISLSDLRQMAAVALWGVQGDTPKLSPAHAPNLQDCPPVYLSTGTRDLLRAGVRDLHAALTNASVPSTLYDAPDMWHVFEVFDETDESLISLKAAADHLLS